MQGMNTGRNDLKLGLDVRVPRETVVGKKMIYYRNLGERWNTEDRGAGGDREGRDRCKSEHRVTNTKIITSTGLFILFYFK